MANAHCYATANIIEPYKYGDHSRRVIVSTWSGAEGRGDEIAEVFQTAPCSLNVSLL